MFNNLIFILSEKSKHVHCVKRVGIRNYYGPPFLAFGLNTERYSRIPSEYGKYGPE